MVEELCFEQRRSAIGTVGPFPNPAGEAKHPAPRYRSGPLGAQLLDLSLHPRPRQRCL